MASLDLDPNFSRALRLLHSKSKDSEEQLRIMLDEAIKQSRGGSKGLSNLPITKEVVTKKDVSKSSSSSLSGKKDDFHKETEKLNPEECSDHGTSKRLKSVEILKSVHSKPLVRGSSSPSSTPSPQSMAIGDILGIIKQEPSIKEEPLELDDDDDDDDDGLALEILEEDLTCVVCRGMVVVARNQLVECVECHSLYHQECHQPPVSEADMSDPRSAWYCSNCTKDINKMQGSGNSSGGKQGTSSTGQAADSQSSYIDGSNGKSSLSGATAKTDLSSNFSSTSKTFGGLPLSTSKSGSSSSKPAASSTVPAASQKVVLPKINIVSADKRLQIMKKKAAKMQEKKKHSK